MSTTQSIGQSVGAMLDKSPAAWVTGFAEEKIGKVGTSLLFTGFWGGLAYAMWKGTWIVASKHPVWGTIFGIFALGSAASAIGNAAESPPA
jgi:hypothetical protein